MYPRVRRRPYFKQREQSGKQMANRNYIERAKTIFIRNLKVFIVVVSDDKE